LKSACEATSSFISNSRRSVDGNDASVWFMSPGKILPRRPIVQFDEVAFGVLHVFHAMAYREHNEQKTVMLARSSDPAPR
jgi:hypothetical protein